MRDESEPGLNLRLEAEPHRRRSARLRRDLLLRTLGLGARGVGRAAFLASSVLLSVACGGSKPTSEVPEAPRATPNAEPAPAPAAQGEVGSPERAAQAAGTSSAEPKRLTVALAPKSGSKLAGKITLTEEGTGVRVVLEVEGISPGDHGAHIHETGDCSAPDAKSAGSHYNPGQHPHGLPEGMPRHLGDLGNVTVGKDGKGKLEILIPGANLKPNDPSSFVGRAVIVHEKKDDGGQPVGNAGGRIGCAVIADAT